MVLLFNVAWQHRAAAILFERLTNIGAVQIGSAATCCRRQETTTSLEQLNLTPLASVIFGANAQLGLVGTKNWPIHSQFGANLTQLLPAEAVDGQSPMCQ